MLGQAIKVNSTSPEDHNLRRYLTDTSAILHDLIEQLAPHLPADLHDDCVDEHTRETRSNCRQCHSVISTTGISLSLAWCFSHPRCSDISTSSAVPNTGFVNPASRQPSPTRLPRSSFSSNCSAIGTGGVRARA